MFFKALVILAIFCLMNVNLVEGARKKTRKPTRAPTLEPTMDPTYEPTSKPTKRRNKTKKPTPRPTAKPVKAPVSPPISPNTAGPVACLAPDQNGNQVFCNGCQYCPDGRLCPNAPTVNCAPGTPNPNYTPVAVKVPAGSYLCPTTNQYGGAVFCQPGQLCPGQVPCPSPPVPQVAVAGPVVCPALDGNGQQVLCNGCQLCPDGRACPNAPPGCASAPNPNYSPVNIQIPPGSYLCPTLDGNGAQVLCTPGQLCPQEVPCPSG